MTKERAIEILSQCDSIFSWKDGQPIPSDLVSEAIRMAIDALSDGTMVHLSSKPTSIICPSCGKMAGWNSYFASYNCGYCGWRGKDGDEWAGERPVVYPYCHGPERAKCESCDSTCSYRQWTKI